MDFARVVLKAETTMMHVNSTGANTPEWEDVDFTTLEQDQPYILWWKSTDELCGIAYMQDPLREIRYYHLTGTDLEKHESIIRKRMPTFSREEITALMADARTPADKVIAVYHAAASASAVPDAVILDFLTRCLNDTDAAVRRAAVDAALVALWPALRTPLKQVAAADPDRAVREFAEETLATLQERIWNAEPGTVDFAPLAPDPRRITPLTGIRDIWHERAFGKRPPAPAAAPTPVPSRKPAFQPPDWLTEVMQAGDWGGVHWHSAAEIRAAASQSTEFGKPPLMIITPRNLERSRALWESMVLVGTGPAYTDRVGRTDPTRLFINRDDPQGLFLALGPDHPPTLWVPAGRSRASVDAAIATYLFAGIPPQAELPFQGRLFLGTLSMIGESGFTAVERGVSGSLFTDMLPWGSSHAVDPYPERVELGRVPVPELRGYMAQAPDGLPRTSIRTRYSRAIIQLIDWRDGYFADLYFQPAMPAEWTETHNRVFGTDFPVGTPVDIIGALSGLSCLGPQRIRPQAEAATDPDQRAGILEIVGFLEEVSFDERRS